MKVLFDTNVLLDVLLDRRPHVEASARALALCESAEVNGYVSAISLTTIQYLARRVLSAAKTRQAVRDLLSILEVAPVDRTVLETALHLKFTDYEDAVIHQSAQRAGVEAIVTRDLRGFRRASLTVYSPLEAVALWGSSPP